MDCAASGGIVAINFQLQCGTFAGRQHHDRHDALSIHHFIRDGRYES